MYDGGCFGGYTRWAVVFLIIFVLFFLWFLLISTESLKPCIEWQKAESFTWELNESGKQSSANRVNRVGLSSLRGMGDSSSCVVWNLRRELNEKMPANAGYRIWVICDGGAFCVRPPKSSALDGGQPRWVSFASSRSLPSSIDVTQQQLAIGSIHRGGRV